MSLSRSNVFNASSWTIEGSPDSLAWPPRPHSPSPTHLARFCSTQTYLVTVNPLCSWCPLSFSKPFSTTPFLEASQHCFFFFITTWDLCLLRDPVCKTLSNDSHFLTFTPLGSLLPHGIGTTCVTSGDIVEWWASHSLGSHPPCHEGTPVNPGRNLHGERLKPPAQSQHRLASSGSEPAWNWILRESPRKTFRCLWSWPIPWLHPHKTTQVRITQLDCSQIPDP